MTLIAEPRLPKEATTVPRLTAADADAITIALDEQGCLIIESVLGADEVRELNDQLDPWMDAAFAGEGPFFGRRTRRFSGVFAKAASTAALAIHTTIVGAIEAALLGRDHEHGDCIQLSQTQAIEIAPGEGAQFLHRDDDVFPMPKTSELIVNVMWTLDRFTAENGATLLVPGSHTWARQVNEQYYDSAVAAEAPAGSAIIWTGALIHGGGANRTQRPRRGLVMSYSLGWLAPAEKLLLSTPPHVARTLPERLQRLIGYQLHRPNLGWVEGRDPLDWLDGRTGLLAAAADNLQPMQAKALEDYLASTVG